MLAPRARGAAVAPSGARARLRRRGTRCSPCTSAAAATTTRGWRPLVLAALAAAASGRRQLAGVCWAVRAREVGAARAAAAARARGARDRPPRRSPRLRGGGRRRRRGRVRGVRNGWLQRVRPARAEREPRDAVGRCRTGCSSSACRTRLRSRCSRSRSLVAYAWLAREAWRGRARLGLAACAALLAVPYLVVWYVVWAVPLAAAEDDEPAGLLSLALCAYLLRQTIPL